VSGRARSGEVTLIGSRGDPEQAYHRRGAQLPFKHFHLASLKPLFTASERAASRYSRECSLRLRSLRDIVNMKDGASPVIIEETDDSTEAKERLSSGRQHLKSWWEPILRMKFDDPEQEAPFWLATNNAVLNTPFPGIQIKAYSLKDGSQIGVFVSGPRRANVMMIQKYLRRERDSLLRALPKGTEVNAGSCKIAIAEFDMESDDDKREWIMKTLNDFANVLRPRLRKWYQESIR
jgi:hypothetical protein